MRKMTFVTILLALLLILPLSYFFKATDRHQPITPRSSTPPSETMPAAAAKPAALESFKLYPALFIAHGGGPLPVLNDPGSKPLSDSWRKHTEAIVAKYGAPRTIAVVSAHYNSAMPCVGGNPFPTMLYDYGGFPRESYSLKYPAPGNSDLARDMVAAMRAAGLDAQLDIQRPYDHGVFVPLLMTFREADIPVVPISVLISDDPAEHIKMGQALRPFREKGVFFLGSGASMHHFGNFMKRGAGSRFGDALTAVLASSTLTPAERLEKMRHVETFDGFDEAQPRGAHEHLMPLLTLVGTADGNPAQEVSSVPFMAANVRQYLFEEI